jgi:hypothetical protein
MMVTGGMTTARIRGRAKAGVHAAMRGLTVPAFVAATVIGCAATAADGAAAIEGKAEKALQAVFPALMSGNPEKVGPFLAPEFQVQRSDGKGYDKEAYLALSIPKIAAMPTFRDLAITRNGDIVVVRLMLEIEETINGKVADHVSPQLMVFRITPDGWQVVAAANFARLA